MNDLRLNRLAELWQRSLETGLQQPEEAELQALLDDAELAEAWAEQAGAGVAEEAPQGTDSLPRGLRSEYQRRFRPLAYWTPRLAVPAALLLAWAFWPAERSAGHLTAEVDEQAYSEAGLDPTPRPQRPDLGPPPGMDQRRELWVTRKAGSLQVEVAVPERARVKARIVDASGEPLKSLDLGTQGPGKVRIDWDGRLEGGRRAPTGAYKIQVYMDGALGAERQVQVEKR